MDCKLNHWEKNFS